MQDTDTTQTLINSLNALGGALRIPRSQHAAPTITEVLRELAKAIEHHARAIETYVKEAWPPAQPPQ